MDLSDFLRKLCNFIKLNSKAEVVQLLTYKTQELAHIQRCFFKLFPYMTMNQVYVPKVQEPSCTKSKYLAIYN